MNAIEVIPMMIAPILIHACSVHADSEVKSLWGDALYVDMSVGDSFSYLEKGVTLLGIKGNYCTIDVNGQSKQLIVARRALPEVINGIRVFSADNQNVKQLTNDNQNHGLLTRDALLCLSDPDKPLLNPDL